MPVCDHSQILGNFCLRIFYIYSHSLLANKQYWLELNLIEVKCI